MNRSPLASAATKFWQTYLELGPGNVQPEDLAEFLTLADHAKASFQKACFQTPTTLAPTFPSTHEALLVLEKLFLRCVHNSNGLCFVTGEAGLIPRQDLHAQIESILKQLEALESGNR